MDTFIDWAIEAGHPIKRIDDYADWYRRFETALRGLPEKQRQHSSLPLLHQLRRPDARDRRCNGVDRAFSGRRAQARDWRGKDIPHLSGAFIRKYLDDLRVLRLV